MATVCLLQATQLEGAYEEAFKEWAASGDADAWEDTSGDGLPA